ncbi:DUF4249 domain-containing protein [Dyadobacter sandarakinus]|uniref:DUF4249 domain-containing protein n=1 Tax=Dyadobacter sandarakinus TaxID=2747268 RepID=A0ABX7IBF0_9BACT|nr:DUF4249 domain-containing protein [Dyadobacter sandarakinus]QRR02256.1 DUF4249 domain-containing protein [Dyadobacter sandarakinus]
MKYWLLKISFFALILALDSCIEPFSPPEVNSDQGYLVVDGFLNVGNDSSKITLRRTQNVNVNTFPAVVAGAAIVAESETGESYNFTETGSGEYILPPYPFNRSTRYRLRVSLGADLEYLSEFVDVTQTPAIDSVTYKYDPNQDAMVFYVNTHDAQNKTQFYRWKFEETWEYFTAYASNLEVVDSQVVTRRQQISRCWRTMPSGGISLGSTVKLSADIIRDLPLIKVPVSTNKLYSRYSILVKQYALSRPEFEYWTSLSKSTQITGGLFDPQPGQVTGNFQNTSDPQDLVFGYFRAGTEDQKRLTVSPGLGNFPRCALPDTLPVLCTPATDVECAAKTAKLLLNYYGPRSDFVLATTPDCADCRLQGGTTNKPSYWDR